MEPRVTYLDDFSICFCKLIFSDNNDKCKFTFILLEVKRKAKNKFISTGFPAFSFKFEPSNVEDKSKLKKLFLESFHSATFSKKLTRPILFLDDLHHQQFTSILSFFEFDLLYKYQTWSGITWNQYDYVIPMLSVGFDHITIDSHLRKDIKLVEHSSSSLLQVYEMTSKAANEDEVTEFKHYKDDIVDNKQFQLHNSLVYMSENLFD